MHLIYTISAQSLHVIEFKNATKIYGKRAVLDNVNLNIQGGEWVSLMGASGAGKTTLVHALIGAIPLTFGEIFVDGYNVTTFNRQALQEYRRRIGIVFQDYKLLPKKTAYENVAFAMEVCGYTEGQITRRANEVLEIVGLKDARHHFPYMLSGGEKQRVAIARALIHEPRLLVADEPTGNLDPETGRGIVDLFQKLNIEGVTIIFATHNWPLIKNIPQRKVQLEDGKVLET